jgi:hypothetical protein
MMLVTPMDRDNRFDSHNIQSNIVKSGPFYKQGKDCQRHGLDITILFSILTCLLFKFFFTFRGINISRIYLQSFVITFYSFSIFS